MVDGVGRRGREDRMITAYAAMRTARQIFDHRGHRRLNVRNGLRQFPGIFKVRRRPIKFIAQERRHQILVEDEELGGRVDILENGGDLFPLVSGVVAGVVERPPQETEGKELTGSSTSVEKHGDGGLL